MPLKVTSKQADQIVSAYQHEMQRSAWNAPVQMKVAMLVALKKVFGDEIEVVAQEAQPA